MAATASTSSLIMVDDGDEVTNPPTTRSPTPVPAQNNDVTDWLMNESPSEFVETRGSREVKDGEIDKEKRYTSLHFNSCKLQLQAEMGEKCAFKIVLKNKDTHLRMTIYDWNEICRLYQRMRISIIRGAESNYIMYQAGERLHREKTRDNNKASDNEWISPVRDG
ncbi:hypothetical protein QAD02_002597 [Eretmocerus hayati]|uniref:Uncharacterized protein n=1 Tax=Eretmocerus hayati TaxID=131215 RepID=A0ACC2NKB9_9HYME|nr:hypothetical protein QAD02_002597 [Eretmocerus hayati]